MEELLQAEGRAALLWDQGVALVMTYVPRLVLAILTLIIGLWLIKRFMVFLDARLHDKDPTLTRFLSGLISATLKILLLISVASMVGIATTSFVAVVGAAGLAVGLALQGSLSNFAGGVLILIFKPFKVGNFIETQGYTGTVAEINILYTILNTPDNRRIIIPNGALSNASMINITAYPTRRCDMIFNISYRADIDKAKALCRHLIESDERALQEPAPVVVVSALGEGTVTLTVRVWTKSSDVWPFTWDMQERVKKAFDNEGISMALPHRNVYLHNVEEA